MAQYDAYILRIWRSTGTGGRQWTARLEHMQAGDRRQFTDLEALLCYLRVQAGLEATTVAHPDGQDHTSSHGHGPYESTT